MQGERRPEFRKGRSEWRGGLLVLGGAVLELREWVAEFLDGVPIVREGFLVFGDGLPVLREGLPMEGDGAPTFGEASRMFREWAPV